tara:strand:+ start:129 stop:485 length:357 start_codon:yes stop_codon:yes gene_type:complete
MPKLVKDMTPEQREANKRAYDKKYYENNREKLKANSKNYKQTEAGKKSDRITHWRLRGIVYHDFEDLYDYVYNECSHCENCCHKFIDKHNKYRRCVDHCHETGEIRAIICHSCNVRRG